MEIRKMKEEGVVGVYEQMSESLLEGVGLSVGEKVICLCADETGSFLRGMTVRDVILNSGNEIVATFFEEVGYVAFGFVYTKDKILKMLKTPSERIEE